MSKLIRYKENPFLDKLNIQTRNKSVRVNAIGKDDNVLVNQHTGEIKGTHVSTYKQVDDMEFVKLFAANIALTFDLTSAGIKAFNVLMWAVQYKAIQKDIVILDKYALDDFLIASEKAKQNQKVFSKKTFDRGLSELVKAQIIARCERPGFFFINPSFVFNGDRIAFTRIIERKTEEQQDLFDEGGES